ADRAVSSYLTFSPLPVRSSFLERRRRCVFCGTFRRRSAEAGDAQVLPGSAPMEPGLSSSDANDSLAATPLAPGLKSNASVAAARPRRLARMPLAGLGRVIVVPHRADAGARDNAPNSPDLPRGNTTMHPDPRNSAKPLAIATMLTPTERLRVDAAGDGWYQTIHRDSVAEVVQDLKSRRAGAVVLSVARCDSAERAAV